MVVVRRKEENIRVFRFCSFSFLTYHRITLQNGQQEDSRKKGCKIKKKRKAKRTRKRKRVNEKGRESERERKQEREEEGERERRRRVRIVSHFDKEKRAYILSFSRSLLKN